jgi:hypothetical protein
VWLQILSAIGHDNTSKGDKSMTDQFLIRFYLLTLFLLCAANVSHPQWKSVVGLNGMNAGKVVTLGSNLFVGT